MTPEAHAHLSRHCPVMKRLIKAHGPCALVLESDRSPFAALASAIAHQQLHGTAAEAILGRFCALFPRGGFPTAQKLASVSDEQLRGCGFSGGKIAALRDLAAKTIDGTVPPRAAVAKLSDDELVERLTEVRGIGRWSVEMFLIFTLGRPDVLPADDFGVRSGYRIAFGLDEMPKPKELLAYGERWRPHATTAAWFLWRAADAAKETK